ncbi:MAG: hypothetical protein ABMB14_33845 [Myxococcota bacterium]
MATFVAWSDAGAPEGDPADGVTGPLPPLAGLDRVDQTIATPVFVPEAEGTPIALHDEYRCFLIEDPFPTDTFLTGFEVDPGEDAIVHHVLGMPVDPDLVGYAGRTNAEEIALVNGVDGRDGWDCFGTAGENIAVGGVPIVWAPGMGAVELPDGVGLKITDRDLFVVQIHYNLVDPATVGRSDSTAIHLRTADAVDRQAYLALPDDFLASLFYGDPEVIPPGESAYPFAFELPGWMAAATAGVPQAQWYDGFDLVGVMPHMHGLGAKEQLRVTRAGGDAGGECLADVQRWDFDWQLQYFYEEPVAIGPDDALEITCTFDSSGRTEPTLPGWGTENEMCLMTLMVVPR